METQAPLSGPDLREGVEGVQLREGEPLLGHADGEAIVVVRVAGLVYAVGASCTHYGGPLVEGTVFGGAIHCPWHHACFDLETGRARGAAIAPVPCWDVIETGGRVRVGARRRQSAPVVSNPERVVIVGAGAAGVACSEALRGQGHHGTITMLTAEGSNPVDRPNLSKDYLAGNAPEEWAYLRTGEALAAIDVSLVADPAAAIDVAKRTVETAGGRVIGWDALLIATGAEPVRLDVEGARLDHVHVLRTLADSRAIGAAVSAGTPVVVVGASFIGLEAAASLRARGAAVTVVGREGAPLARVLGDQVGAFVRRVHEANGVTFQLGREPKRITATKVVLDDGSVLPAAVVVLGVGVRPRLELARAAGLAIDRGVVVDEELRAAPAVWAAGDIARFPWDGERVRIEHWQVAVRHGQAVADSMLGRGPRRDVPFFWSQHHDVTLGYVGHSERFDSVEVVGDLDGRDAHVVYLEAERVRAVATIGRDRLALQAEEAMAAGDHGALAALVRPRSGT